MVRTIDPLARLEKFRAKFATQKEAARALGVSPQFLNDLVRRRRDCPDSILSKLGLVRVIVPALRPIR